MLRDLALRVLVATSGRLPSRDLHAPLVRLHSLMVSVGRHTALLGGDAEHVGTDIRQTVKLRGNPEGQRFRPGVATSLDTTL